MYIYIVYMYIYIVYMYVHIWTLATPHSCGTSWINKCKKEHLHIPPHTHTHTHSHTHTHTHTLSLSLSLTHSLTHTFSGVPAIVDFAVMRDAVKSLGGDPSLINPVCPADLVIDHSVQVDYFRRCIRISVCVCVCVCVRVCVCVCVCVCV